MSNPVSGMNGDKLQLVSFSENVMKKFGGYSDNSIFWSREHGGLLTGRIYPDKHHLIVDKAHWIMNDAISNHSYLMYMPDLMIFGDTWKPEREGECIVGSFHSHISQKPDLSDDDMNVIRRIQQSGMIQLLVILLKDRIVPYLIYPDGTIDEVKVFTEI